jgi:hypothetical protein
MFITEDLTVTITWKTTINMAFLNFNQQVCNSQNKIKFSNNKKKKKMSKFKVKECHIYCCFSCNSHCKVFSYEHNLKGGVTQQLHVQSVPINTKVVSSNPVHSEVYLIQHYVIKFVSFIWVLRFHPQIKRTTTI